MKSRLALLFFSCLIALFVAQPLMAQQAKPASGLTVTTPTGTITLPSPCGVVGSDGEVCMCFPPVGGSCKSFTGVSGEGQASCRNAQGQVIAECYAYPGEPCECHP